MWEGGRCAVSALADLGAKGWDHAADAEAHVVPAVQRWPDVGDAPTFGAMVAERGAEVVRLVDGHLDAGAQQSTVTMTGRCRVTCRRRSRETSLVPV